MTDLRLPPAEAGLGLPDWALVDPDRRAHVERVVALLADWADQMELPTGERRRWLRAGWLHDALRAAPTEQLRVLAPHQDCVPDLLHGPAAAARAAQDGETDLGVLDAIHYHSTGYAGWDTVGKALYCADFLEPGRSFDPAERADLARRFPADPDAVLRDVARRRMQYLARKGWPLTVAGWQFWNQVACASA